MQRGMQRTDLEREVPLYGGVDIVARELHVLRRTHSGPVPGDGEQAATTCPARNAMAWRPTRTMGTKAEQSATAKPFSPSLKPAKASEAGAQIATVLVLILVLVIIVVLDWCRPYRP